MVRRRNQEIAEQDLFIRIKSRFKKKGGGLKIFDHLRKPVSRKDALKISQSFKKYCYKRKQHKFAFPNGNTKISPSTKYFSK